MTPVMDRFGYGFNVAAVNTPPCFIESMFNPEPGEAVNLIPVGTDWSDLAVSLGIFPSKGQARKNGWTGKLPSGYSERRTRKHGTIFLYVPTEQLVKLYNRVNRA